MSDREHLVCRVEELGPGERLIVALRGHDIGIFNVDGRFYALHDRCPHRGGPLCRGRIGGTTLPTDSYAFRYGRDGEILRCAWHGWEFDIATGHALTDPRIVARTYPVHVRDGHVVVTV